MTTHITLIDSDKYSISCEGYIRVQEIVRDSLKAGSDIIMVGGSTTTKEQVAMCWLAAKTICAPLNVPMILFPHLADDVKGLDVGLQQEILDKLKQEAKEKGIETSTITIQ